ncbi:MULTISPECIES: hypothetical protein [unclassified Klebsiella]|uniref:hypothetical protein n=1 Tax=unclassified Klebsiella TaxID=2608929 RepID=UPI00105454C7|nr:MULTISPECIES: hypothetical protein [unclassified Klebsiella]
MKHKSKLQVIVFFALIALCYVCYFLLYNSDHVETCRSNMTIQNANSGINSNVIFHFFKDEGVLELHGVYTLGNKVKNKIDRQIKFNLKRNGNKLILTNERVINKDDENSSSEVINSSLSDFFIKPGTTLILDRISSLNGEKIFQWSGLPILYCFKN